MHRSTLFVVEGQTEQVFLLKFIEQLVAIGSCHVKLQKLHAGQIFELAPRGTPLADATHLIQILNVENDEKVNSYIADNIDAIKEKGFHAVFGLRDRYTGSTTRPVVDVPSIDAWAAEMSGTYAMDVAVTVAIEEIEAWFLSVPSFLEKIHRRLNLNEVNRVLGFDLGSRDVETIDHPSLLIDKSLASVGLGYKKKLADACKIAEYLDYSTLYFDRAPHIASLGRLVNQLDASLP